MTLLSYETPQQLPPGLRDRRAALTAAGTLAIILGMCTGAVALLMLVMLLLPGAGNAPRSRGEVVGQVVLCAGAAAFLIWAGIGSIRNRRWVRPVMLAAGWTWLAMGGLFLIFYVISFIPRMIEVARATKTGTGAPATFAGGVAFAGCFVLLLYTFLPAIFVWCYHRPGVRETLAHFDREPRWTDGCPIPVLALSLWLVTIAAATAADAFARPVLPLFGVALTGVPAAAGFLGVAAALLWLARATFRLRLAGWWAAVLALVLYLISYVITAFAGDLTGAYLRAGYSFEEIEDLSGGMGRRTTAVWFTAFWAIAFGYLVYVRRFFIARATESPAAPVEGFSAPPP